MKNSTTVVILVSSILLTACASQTGWTPTVDSYGDKNAAMINQDMAQCKDLASHAGSTGKNVAIGTGTGALIGGATGAAIGAVFGSPGMGAAVGAAAGGIGGGTQQGFSSEETYKRSYNTCMRNRGHNVIN